VRIAKFGAHSLVWFDLNCSFHNFICYGNFKNISLPSRAHFCALARIMSRTPRKARGGAIGRFKLHPLAISNHSPVCRNCGGVGHIAMDCSKDKSCVDCARTNINHSVVIITYV
jgi:hypothetical protein